MPASPSFPSGHATTSFAAAAAVAILVPRLRVPAFALAALVGFSRVYLGVHYTLDVLCGAVLGTLIGVGIALAARRAAQQPARRARPSVSRRADRLIVTVRTSDGVAHREPQDLRARGAGAARTATARRSATSGGRPAGGAPCTGGAPRGARRRGRATRDAAP